MLSTFKGSYNKRSDGLSLKLKDILGLFNGSSNNYSNSSTKSSNKGSNKGSNDNCEKSLGPLDRLSNVIKDGVSLDKVDDWWNGYEDSSNDS